MTFDHRTQQSKWTSKGYVLLGTCIGWTQQEVRRWRIHWHSPCGSAPRQSAGWKNVHSGSGEVTVLLIFSWHLLFLFLYIQICHFVLCFLLVSSRFCSFISPFLPSLGLIFFFIFSSITLSALHFLVLLVVTIEIEYMSLHLCELIFSLI